MPLSKLSHLKYGEKYNIRLLVIDKNVNNYSGGERTRVMASDEDNCIIDLVGFADVKEIMNKLLIGKTYILNDVVMSKFNDQRQLKIVSSSSIHESSLELTFVDTCIDSVLKNNIGQYMNFYAVVSYVSEDVNTTSSGGKMRKYAFSDSTGTVYGSAMNDAAVDIVPLDTIVAIRAKMGNHSSLLLFSRMTPILNENLRLWWIENKSEHTKIKRCKIEYTPIKSINESMIGEKIEVCGVISSVELNASITKSGYKKKAMVVADASCFSIEVIVFGDMSNIDIVPGKNICFSGYVTEWNYLSITINSNSLKFESIDRVNTFESMAKWWLEVGKFSEITNLTNNSSPIMCSIENILDKFVAENTRVTVKGYFSKKTLKGKDNIGIRIQIHSSFKDFDDDFESEVTLKNVSVTYINDVPEIIVFKSSIHKS